MAPNPQDLRRPRFLASVSGGAGPVPASFGAPRPGPLAPAAHPPASGATLPREGTGHAAPPQAGPVEGSGKLAAAVEVLRAQAARLAEQARADAIEIGFQVAKKILEQELAAGPQALFGLVRSALRRAGDSRKLLLRLHPADAAVVEAARGDPALAELAVARVEVVADASLAPGDAIVETDFGNVDGRLATRLGEVRRAVDAAQEVA